MTKHDKLRDRQNNGHQSAPAEESVVNAEQEYMANGADYEDRVPSTTGLSISMQSKLEVPEEWKEWWKLRHKLNGPGQLFGPYVKGEKPYEDLKSIMGKNGRGHS